MRSPALFTAFMCSDCQASANAPFSKVPGFVTVKGVFSADGFRGRQRIFVVTIFRKGVTYA